MRILRPLFLLIAAAMLGAGCSANGLTRDDSVETHPVAPAQAPNAAPAIPQNAQNVPKPIGY